MKKKKLEPWPEWMEGALQGVAFWIGHRRALYRHYPLGESAVVAEICNLIYGNLTDDLRLECEVQYSSILPRDSVPPILKGRPRADLVIFSIDQSNKIENLSPKFVIEVKRASASRRKIDDDLRRLAAVRDVVPEVRTFLFVVSEAKRPKRFVSDVGASLMGDHPIREVKNKYRVRRTWKAAHAFNHRDKANYSCLIEVFRSGDR